MNDSAQNPTNLVPGPATDDLVALLMQDRPWQNRGRVSVQLVGWSHFYSRPIARANADILAETLESLGRWADPPPIDVIAQCVVRQLRNIAGGRDPSDDGRGRVEAITRTFEVFDPSRPESRSRAWPSVSTRNRWKREAAVAQRLETDPEKRMLDALDPTDRLFTRTMEALQREHDLAGLIGQGRSREAAERWLNRHNPDGRLDGQHAHDASAPRGSRSA